MEHDFKAALEWLLQKHRGTTAHADHPLAAIEFALRFTAKALGEPSDAVIQAGWDRYREDFHCNGKFDTQATFKAMVQQAIKEINAADKEG